MLKHMEEGRMSATEGPFFSLLHQERLTVCQPAVMLENINMQLVLFTSDWHVKAVNTTPFFIVQLVSEKPNRKAEVLWGLEATDQV